MKLPQYRLLKISWDRKGTSIKAEWVDFVTCGECKYRDPENKKCDCGAIERQGCKFPVNDEYFCSYGERSEE